jgi:predicted transcriptional regulator
MQGSLQVGQARNLSRNLTKRLLARIVFYWNLEITRTIPDGSGQTPAFIRATIVAFTRQNTTLVLWMPSERYAYILLAKEKWWRRLCDQKEAGKDTQAFVRRGLVGPKNAKIVLFYVTRPHKEIRGYATFLERVTGDAEDLWHSHGHEASLKSHEEYVGFLQTRQNASFIRFRDLQELRAPVPAKTISRVTGKRRMPRSGTYISKKMAHELIGRSD